MGENRPPADLATGGNKKDGGRWKRGRRSLQHRREAAAFRAEQDRFLRLQAAEVRGQLEMFSFEAAGFSLSPCVPDAWQPPGVTSELPSGGRQRRPVLGLLKRANEA